MKVPMRKPIECQHLQGLISAVQISSAMQRIYQELNPSCHKLNEDQNCLQISLTYPDCRKQAVERPHCEMSQKRALVS